MSTFTEASLIMLPCAGRKEGELYLIKPTNNDSNFNVNRNGVASFKNDGEPIQFAEANIVRTQNGALFTEPQATQIYQLTDVMSTQTKTTTANNYVVSFYGLGTITFTGTHIGSLVGTGVNDRVEVTFLATAGSLISTVSGTVNNGQLQLGIKADSYIRNTGTGIQSRLADQITGAGTVNDFNSEEGTFIWSAASAKNSISPNSGISLGVGNARISMRFSSATNKINMLIVAQGATQVNLSYTLDDSTLFHKFVMTYKKDDTKLYVEGTPVLSDTSCLMPLPNEINQLLFTDGASANVNFFFGQTKQLIYVKRVLTPTEIQNL